MKAWLLIMAAGLLASMPGAANAYCWGTDLTMPGASPDFYSVQMELDRSTYVAVVRVLDETWLDDDGRPTPLKPPFAGGAARPLGLADAYMGAFYGMEVERAFKGQPPKRLRLFSENTTARFWMFPGERYLAFISLTDTDGLGRRWAVDNCGNTAKLEEAGPVLRRLQRMTRPSSPRPSSARR